MEIYRDKHQAVPPLSSTHLPDKNLLHSTWSYFVLKKNAYFVFKSKNRSQGISVVTDFSQWTRKLQLISLVVEITKVDNIQL